MIDYLRQIDFETIRSLNQLALRSSFLEFFVVAFARYAIILFVVVGLYYLVKRSWRTISVSAITIGLAGFLNSLIYIVWDRPRPFVAHASEIRQVGLFVQPESFTSVHSFITFGVATAFWVTGKRKIAFWLYVLAVLITVARIAAGVHYPSDIIAGALLGIASAPLAKQFYLLILKYKND